MDLPDEEPHILSRVLAYLYLKEFYYELPESLKVLYGAETGYDRQHILLEAYLCADRLNILKLKAFLISEVEKDCPNNIPTNDLESTPHLVRILENTTPGDDLRNLFLSNFLRVKMFHGPQLSDDYTTPVSLERIRNLEPGAYATALLAAECIKEVDKKEEALQEKIQKSARIEINLKKARHITRRLKQAAQGIIECVDCGEISESKPGPKFIMNCFHHPGTPTTMAEYIKEVKERADIIYG